MAQQIAVIGLGSFGNSVARSLSELGQEVMAIDVADEEVKKLAPSVTHAVGANVMDIDALRAVG